MAVLSVAYRGRSDVGGGQLRHVFDATTDDRGVVHVEVTLPRSASDTEVYAAARARFLIENAPPGTGASIPVGPVSLAVFAAPPTDPLIAPRETWLQTLDRLGKLQRLKTTGVYVGTETLKNGVTVDAQIAAWQTSLRSDIQGLATIAAQLFYLDGSP